MPDGGRQEGARWILPIRPSLTNRMSRHEQPRPSNSVVGIVWLGCGLVALAAPAASATVTAAPQPATEPLQVQSPDGTIEATISSTAR